jgi:uncharacterized damage-inducible protein DinB
MDLLTHLRRQFAYDAWANREVLSGLKRVPSPPPRAVKLLAHVLGTEHEWMSRILGRRSPVAIWPEFTLADCERHATELPELWWHFLQTLDSERLAQRVSYTNTKGQEFENTVSDILTHVILHSAYHRGQIAREIRESGDEPSYTDFIHGVRQGLFE